jgi:hypothetical protein
VPPIYHVKKIIAATRDIDNFLFIQKQQREEGDNPFATVFPKIGSLLLAQ